MRQINLPWVALTSLVLLLPMTSASKANALDVDFGSGYSRVNIDGHDHDRDYKYGHDYKHEYYSVFYRRPQYDHWRLAGNYRSRDAAEHTQHELREHGYIARIERN